MDAHPASHSTGICAQLSLWYITASLTMYLKYHCKSFQGVLSLLGFQEYMAVISEHGDLATSRLYFWSAVSKQTTWSDVAVGFCPLVA